MALLGGLVALGFAVAALLAPLLVAHDPNQGDLGARLRAPAWVTGDMTHPLGTDSVGRDLLSRIVYGARTSLGIGIITVALSAAVGTALGLAAGWRGGWPDRLASRFADFLLAFPVLIFAIGVLAIFGPGFWVIVGALSFQAWVEFYRLVRGETLVQREQEYVQAARALGRPMLGILAFEILPNVVYTVLALSTIRIGYVIIAESSLSFLGIGIQPPTPAWGSMVSDGRDFMLTAWWVPTLPGLAAVVLVLGLNLFGEGLRQVLDPRGRPGNGKK